MVSSLEKNGEIRSSNYSRGRNISVWSSGSTTLCALTHQHFVAVRSASNRPPSSKQMGDRCSGTKLSLRWRKSEESAIFQWSNPSVFLPVEFFSKHPQTRHDILDITTLCFVILFSKKSRWFCKPLWFRYHVWIRRNASPPCVINMRIFFHVWNLMKFESKKSINNWGHLAGFIFV